MKKFLSVALALVMVCALMVPAFAAVVNTDGVATNETLIKTSTKTEGGDDAEGYTVIIPADTTIPWGAASTDVGYSVESHLARDKQVTVAVAGTGSMKTADGKYALPYTLDGATAYAAGAEVVYPAAAQALSVLVADDDWNRAVVEEYTDILTYTVAVAAL